MDESARLNGAIAAFERGDVVFGTFLPAQPSAAIEVNGGPYDVAVFDLEHNVFDLGSLRDSLQYLLNRRDIASRAALSPLVTPLVRLPVNGAEMSQWLAKQVLDIGAYGVVWPHVSTVEQARNAVASCRYPGPRSRPTEGVGGIRGDGPFAAARYWGVELAEYYRRAEPWPLAAGGEILVVIMCEDVMGVDNLPRILNEVQGIGAVLIGEGDLSQDVGHPRNYQHPEVVAMANRALEACLEAGVPCGTAHVTATNLQKTIDDGFRLVLSSPRRVDPVVEMRWAGH